MSWLGKLACWLGFHDRQRAAFDHCVRCGYPRYTSRASMVACKLEETNTPPPDEFVPEEDDRPPPGVTRRDGPYRSPTPPKGTAMTTEPTQSASKYPRDGGVTIVRVREVGKAFRHAVTVVWHPTERTPEREATYATDTGYAWYDRDGRLDAFEDQLKAAWTKRQAVQFFDELLAEPGS